MGCFLSCFRARPDPSGGGLQDPLVRESRLGDAFLNDDDTAKLEAGGGTLKEDLGNDGDVEEELRREANYLKSCGAISETPPEILEVSKQINSEDSNEANYLKSCGAISETPPEILEASKQINSEDSNECSEMSNVGQVIEGEIVSEDKECSSEEYSCDGHDTLSHYENIDEGAENVGVKSVPGPSLQDKSSCQNIRNEKLDSSDSPFPTPLVLRGDIQTPGTISTAYQGNFKSGKRGRTSRQFIYPVLRPIENKLQWQELKDESSPVSSSNPPKRRYLCTDSTEKPKETFPISVTNTELPDSAPFSFHASNKEQSEEVTSPEEPKDQNGNQQLLDGVSGELLKNNSDNGKHGVASLSCWIKTSSADGEFQNGNGSNMGKQPGLEGIGATMDVPIFVASGLNWDIDNPTPLLPKAAWDGNGIPNTTTKYKEDQRVSWHATPFEERLLKVLSDEKPRHQRKISGKLIHLEEDAESLAAAATSSP